MRWSTGVRRSVVALALSAGVGALAVLPAVPSQAEGPYWFKCQGPLAPDNNVAVNIALSSRELTVGQPLVVRWALGVQTPLKVPNPLITDLDEGGHLAITGRVKAHGVWTGQGDIDATDTRFVEAERLRADENLELGTLADGQVIASRAGNGSIEIGSLVVDLAPVVSVWNNDFTPVADFSAAYAGGWNRTDDPGPYDDKFHIKKDVRETTQEGDTASFTFAGTSVDLITDRFSDMNDFELKIDDGFPPAEYTEIHDAYWPVAGERRLHETFSTIELPYGRYTLTVKNKVQDKFARVDAFRVHAATANNLAASPYRTVCSPVENVPLIPITVTEGGNGTGPPDPSETPTNTDDPTDDPTDTGSPTPSHPGTTPTPSTTGTTGTSNGAGGGTTLVDGVLVTTTASSSPRTTRTATATVTASPQVKITPRGAAQTGEAPATGPPPGMLVATGSAMLAGGLLGGVALRRRRAAHAGDRPRSAS